MTTSATSTAAGPRGITVAAAAWTAAAAVYAAMRLLAFVKLPVGGLELWSLSGAWQARAGIDDARYVPTLFQALTALLLRVEDSETLPRLAALAASLTVPVSLFLLRRRIGEPAAIATLLVLAFDPLQIAFGPAATAAAFDVPLTAGILAALAVLGPRPPVITVAAFLLAAAGPLPLALLLAAALTHPRADWRQPAAGFAAAGAALGVLAASFGFGAGWQGITVPPFDLFATGFDAGWSTETTRRLVALYAWGPAVLAGGYLAIRAARGRAALLGDGLDRLFAAWFGVSLAWCFAAGGSRDPLAVLSLTASAAPLAGRALAWLVDSLGSADWRRAGWPLAGALLAAATLLGPLLDWARLGRVGPGSEVVAVVVLAGVIAGGLTLLLRWPATRAVAILPLAAAAAVPWLAGGFAVAGGSPNEPLPSPVTTLQASEIRDIVTGPARDPVGIVAIHPSLADALTWPLRGSRGLVAASRIPPNASVVIWEAAGAPPEGFRTFEGRWAVLRERRGPDSGFLDYLRWLANRNTLPVRDLPAAVYIREQP
ncbi:hypothetical protein [Tepidiforma sp.]|jgi:hypothetical protein|uniref:hypothetical protein n=1 Tax=Tepidiforma sp. TaxID=2682230 RepID=UPI00260E5927|nr:hypothetical protein [Tepidiforma sp.]MCX7618146.1 hypothetical protein [Tepidiforma sp.]